MATIKNKQKNTPDNNQQNIPSPDEVLAHGIMQLDGTYRYKGKIFDENGKLLEADREEDKNIVEEIIKKEDKNKGEKKKEEEKSDKTKDQENKGKQEKSFPRPKIDKNTNTEDNVTPSISENKNNKDIFTEYPREKIQSLITQLPPEVRDILTSDKEVDDVENICKRYNVEDKFMEIQKMILYVALGLRTMEDFKNYIKDKVAKNEEEAGKIYREIFRFVFFPVKDLIGVTYKMNEKIKNIEEANKNVSNIRADKTKVNESEKKPIIKDKYREPI